MTKQPRLIAKPVFSIAVLPNVVVSQDETQVETKSPTIDDIRILPN